MIIKKYKIGNFTVEINSQTDFASSEPYSSFSYDGEQTDYTVSIGFTADLPDKIKSPDYDAQDRVCVYENGVSVCCYKSRDNGNEYYACRKIEGKNTSILIDKKYHDMLREDIIFTLIGIEEMAAESNGCVLHSSFIEKDGGAILFCGPCSIGKSTQANLWKEHADAVVINGDKTMIFEKDGAFYASGMPFSGSSKDCLNKVFPLKAVISLQQAARNSATKLDATDAFYKIYKNCYPVHHSRDLTGGLLDFVQKLGQSVPVFEFACLADESAVRYLERKLCPFMQSL